MGSSTAIKQASYTQLRLRKDKGYATVRVTVDMDIIVDWDAVAQLLARKVARNKAGKSKALQGAVTAIRRKVVETEI